LVDLTVMPTGHFGEQYLLPWLSDLHDQTSNESRIVFSAVRIDER
jgi:hypothetical protein